MAKSFTAGERVHFQRDPNAKWEPGEYVVPAGIPGWHRVKDDTGFRERHVVPGRRISRTAPLPRDPTSLTDDQMKWLRGADSRDLIEWHRGKGFAKAAWERMMKRMVPIYVTEYPHGGYELTDEGKRVAGRSTPDPASRSLSAEQLKALSKVVVSTWMDEDVPVIQTLVPEYVSHDENRRVFGAPLPYVATKLGTSVWTRSLR